MWYCFQLRANKVESTGGALLPLGARFRPPLVNPDMQNYRIRLSDKIMFSPTEGPWSLAQGILFGDIQK